MRSLHERFAEGRTIVFRLCESKVCEDAVGCCESLIPSACGGSFVPTMVDAPCNGIHFTGIGNITVPQGTEIDLTEGVHAFDGQGNEIEFTVTPSEIDSCVTGKVEVIYEAHGIGSKIVPTFCLNEPMLYAIECGTEYSKVRRIITIEPYGIVCESKACCASAMC